MKPTIIKEFPGQAVDYYLKTHGVLPSMCIGCRGEGKEMRPYGPKGAYICFDCAMKPENKAQTERAFKAQLEAAGPIAAIGEGCDDGPRPFGGGSQ